MNKYFLILCTVVFGFLFTSSAYADATDSYRWLHVTIETPWAIFVFLLPMVLAPAILMAILYWRFAFKKDTTASKNIK